MIINKTMFADDVRAFCIKYKMYYNGTNTEYEKMLYNAQKAITDDEIIDVCRDIYNHSKDWQEEYPFTSFAAFVMQNCVNLFIND
jgi:hypothetical protein